MFTGHRYTVYSRSGSSGNGVYLLIALLSLILGFVVYKYLLRESEIWKSLNTELALLVFVSGCFLLHFYLVYLFNRYLWSTILSKFMHRLVSKDPPVDIRGDYKGELSWVDNRREISGNSEIQVTIIQRWKTILIIFRFKDDEFSASAESYSKMAYMELGFDKNSLKLCYSYSYEGYSHLEDGGYRSDRVNGTSVMIFKRNNYGWSANGSYYCDDNGSGKITMSSVN